MQKTTLSIPKMDCAAEEHLVRMAVQGDGTVHRLEANLGARSVDVYHEGPPEHVLHLLEPLNFGAAITESSSVNEVPVSPASDPGTETQTLRIALAINAGMFLSESIGGYLADSSALIADSLDMFADAGVYAIALYGAGQAFEGQRKAARISGWLQLTLALGAAFEVVRRAAFGSEPESALMMGVAVVALIANAVTMWLLARHRTGGAHMKASWIFTTNDVIANLGVIVGAVLVRVSGSAIPDLVVGGIIAALVLSGAVRILRLSRS